MKNKKIMLWFGLLLTAPVTMAQISQKDTWAFSNTGRQATGKLKYDKQQMTINTANTRHAYFVADAFSFAYQQHDFPHDDCSELSVSVKIDTLSGGAAGIMMRSDNSAGSANVHLEISAVGDLLLFFRKSDNEMTSYTRITRLAFPVQIKLLRQGTVFTAFYTNPANHWVKGASAMAAVGSRPLNGFYACSGSESQTGDTIPPRIASAVFRGWNLDYHDDYIPPENNYTDQMPVKEGTLLRDNFNDGSMSNLPATVINPVWKGITYGKLPVDPAGGRYWRKDGDGVFFLGNKKWADYQIDADLIFDKKSKPSSEFTLQARYQDISVYTSMTRYYSVAFRNGRQLVFEKHTGGEVIFFKTVPLPLFFDGARHHLSVRFFDRNYEVYFDNKVVISGIDADSPVTYGNIALKFADASMIIDNLQVTELKDPVNGSADNYLLGYFDDPIPSYLKKYNY